MRYKLTIMSIHVAEVQVVKCFDHGGLCQLQNCHSFVTDKDLRSWNVLLLELQLSECSLSSTCISSYACVWHCTHWLCRGYTWLGLSLPYSACVMFVGVGVLFWSSISTWLIHKPQTLASANRLLCDRYVAVTSSLLSLSILSNICRFLRWTALSSVQLPLWFKW